MIIEEQRAYLLAILRQTPEDAARHIWAAAQLAQLSAAQPANDVRGDRGRKQPQSGNARASAR